MKREDSPWWSAGFTKEWWLALTRADRKAFLDELTPLETEEFALDWRVWGRDAQLAPEKMPDGSDWRTLLIVTGRGWGKTRCAVEFIIDEVENGRAKRIAVVGQGESDIRTVMIEGNSGFIECAKPWNRPKFYPSVGGGQLQFPSGAVAFIYSAEDPEALRGPQFDLAWVDEVMAFPAEKRTRTVSNLRFSLRLGKHPRLLYTTTPKRHRWIREMVADAANPKKKIIIIRGSTYENAENLAGSFIEGVQEDYEGTSLGRQELHGEVLGDEDGALWTDELLDKQRRLGIDVHEFAKTCDKIVVGVDPNIKTGGTAHAAGVIVAAKKGRFRYVLADRTVAGGPSRWAAAAIAAYEEFEAHEIVAESNQGGEMVKITIEAAAQDAGIDARVILRRTQKGKARRAEPVAAAYERGIVFHLAAQGTTVDPGEFFKLEQQLTGIHDAFDPTGEDFDRADALVWALTRLGVKRVSHVAGTTPGGFHTFEELGLNGDPDRDTDQQGRGQRLPAFTDHGGRLFDS